MEQLTCEICGGTNLIKQDGVFVCQNCGTKYSVEEARKMMVEDTMDVSGGTAKVVASDELANLYQIARRAKDDDNSENAAKYYDMILVKDPTSWEAYFYTVYFKAIGYKIEQYQSASDAGHSVANCINSVLKLIKDYVSGKEEQIKAVQEVAYRCTIISGMLYDEAKNYYDNLDIEVRHEYNKATVCVSATLLMFKLGDSVDLLFGDYVELHSTAVSAWKNGIKKNLEFAEVPSDQTMKWNADYIAKVQKYDNNYQDNTANIPYQTVPVPVANNGSSKANGLQIASLILGIFSIVLCCCYGVPSIILGIIGIVCSVMGNKEGKNGVGTGGLICSIVGIVLGLTMFAIIAVGLMAGGMEDFLDVYDSYYYY